MPLSRNGKIDRSSLPRPDSLEGDDAVTDYVPPRTDSGGDTGGNRGGIAGSKPCRRPGQLLRARCRLDPRHPDGIASARGGTGPGPRCTSSGIRPLPNWRRQPSRASISQGSIQNFAREFAPFELAPEGIDLETIKQEFAGSGGIEDLYPLTPMQEGMLFHSLADPDAGHYVEQFTCQIRGAVEPSRLQESWNRLVARHPALRSTIHWIEFDRPYQVVHRRIDQPVQFRDWRELLPGEQDEELTAYLPRTAGAGSCRHSRRCRGSVCFGLPTRSINLSGAFTTR